MKLMKLIFIIMGTISLLIGLFGIFLPGLPTTPFLLLTAGLYIRSNGKLYSRLISNKLIGPYILEFYQRKGMTSATKLGAISLMWIMISISCVFFIHHPIVLHLVILLGIIGTIVMGIIIPTNDQSDNTLK